MRVHGENSDTDCALLESLLRYPRRADGRGRPPREEYEVLNEVLWTWSARSFLYQFE